MRWFRAEPAVAAREKAVKRREPLPSKRPTVNLVKDGLGGARPHGELARGQNQRISNNLAVAMVIKGNPVTTLDILRLDGYTRISLIEVSPRPVPG